MRAFVAFSLAVPPTVMSVAAVVMLLAAAGVTEAQVRYVDGQGQVHWVQAEGQIPEQYRQDATAPQLPSLGQGDATARRVFEGSSRTLDRINAQGRIEDQASADKRFCNEILEKENRFKQFVAATRSTLGVTRPHPSDRRFCGLD